MRSRLRTTPSTTPFSHSTTASTSGLETTGSTAVEITTPVDEPTSASSDRQDREALSRAVARDPTHQTLPSPVSSPLFLPTASSSSQPPTPTSPTCLQSPSPIGSAWSRKRKQRAKAAAMRQRSSGVEEEGATVSDPDFGYRSEEEPDANDTSTDEEFSPQELFDDWMVSLRLDQRKMLSVIAMEHFKSRMHLNVKDAATEAGCIIGKTVRRYRNEFFQNEGHFAIRLQGKYERHCVQHDEAFNHKAAEWVREHAFVKGEPNMTAQSFCDWVNNTLLPSSHLQPNFPRCISLRTAVRWLHHLGFKPVSHKKGVYIDGHEREDVVSHRKALLKTLANLRESHRPPPQCSDEPPRIRREEDDGKKELVVLYHDESIFNTNEGQTWMWGEEDRPAILPKTKGSGIMVSDFVEEHGGYLQLTDAELVLAKERFPDIRPSMGPTKKDTGQEIDSWSK